MKLMPIVAAISSSAASKKVLSIPIRSEISMPAVGAGSHGNDLSDAIIAHAFAQPFFGNEFEIQPMFVEMAMVKLIPCSMRSRKIMAAVFGASI